MTLVTQSTEACPAMGYNQISRGAYAPDEIQYSIFLPWQKSSQNLFLWVVNFLQLFLQKTKIDLLYFRNILYLHDYIYSEYTLLHDFLGINSWINIFCCFKYSYLIVVIIINRCEFKHQKKYEGHKRGSVRYIYKWFSNICIYVYFKCM